MNVMSAKAPAMSSVLGKRNGAKRYGNPCKIKQLSLTQAAHTCLGDLTASRLIRRPKLVAS
jgi:hypothetical protein